MNFFAVVGNPISFSRSPDLFGAMFVRKNIRAKYSRIVAQSAKEAVDLFRELDLLGMNVTAPFKIDIIKYLDKIDDLAQEIGSVNTILNRQGELIGYNTDYDGIVDTLPALKDKHILLLGAGGAAKTVAYAVNKNGGQLSIFNRTTEKADFLASKYKAKVCLQEDLPKLTQEADIIVNTLPLGIKIIEDDWFKTDQIIFDASYHYSVYQDIAKELGLKFFSGSYWLKNQAIPAFQLFFPEENIDAKNINLPKKKSFEKFILTGFMGSGKSIIAKELSKKINYRCFDMDAIIAEEERLSINHIFEQYGESYFRDKEQKLLKELLHKQGAMIISSGGGIVLSEQNRKLMLDNCYSVFLYASPQTIVARINSDNRPLLKNNFSLDFVQKLMSERKDYYLQSADLIINTDGKTIQEIVALVTKEIACLEK